jgi:predicted Mrr-cat superfamily restriction endonuclease
METVTFTSTGDLAFFTKKVENLGAGIYKIKIDTLDKDEKIIYSQDQIVFVKEKAAQPVKPSVFENSQPGTVSFLQNLLRSIFGK